MTHDITRRELLAAAGGITFLALLPVGPGLFAAPAEHGDARASGPLPPPLIYTALPYVQPGPQGKLLAGDESAVIAWQTEDRAAEFTVDFGTTKNYGRVEHPFSAVRLSGDDGEKRRNYAVTLTGLELNKVYHYRVRHRAEVVVEGYFTTRKPRGAPVRIVAFGDNSFGDVSQRAIAYQAYKARPDLIVNTGDNVYDSGCDNEYERYFFPVYNAETASPRVGAPLISAVPFYSVLANHDVGDVGPSGRRVVDFGKHPDSLAYFTALHVPLTGPVTPPQSPTLIGPAEAIANFHGCAGQRFPRAANYSFDVGDAHVLCLDSNSYVDPTDEGWTRYIESDLDAAADARWKIVVFHHGPFNIGTEHYKEQHMRVHAPTFERGGVDVVLSGHEHSYQRTRPIHFRPDGAGRAARVEDADDRRVPGTFTVDRRFDGQTNTRPFGVIYIITGAGGASLYDPGYTDNPALWVHDDDRRVAYVARVVTDRHSFTMLDIRPEAMTIAQVDQWGVEIDKIRITKT
jgi:acid phosphatase type 7